MSSNSDKNISKFQDLLLENEDSPQFDVVLGELLRQAESEVTGKDVSMGEAAFNGFAKNVGLTVRKKGHSALRIVSNIAAALFIPLLFTCLWLSFGAGGETETVWNEISSAYAENASVELSDGTSVKLVPGDIIRYDKEKGNVKRLHFDVNNYERVLAVDGLQFVDATLSEIVGTLSRRFKVDISVEDSIAGEKYYASFINGENLDEILNALNVERHFRINHSNNNIKLTVR